MLLENRSGELIGAWPIIDGALISTVRRSSVIFYYVRRVFALA